MLALSRREETGSSTRKGDLPSTEHRQFYGNEAGSREYKRTEAKGWEDVRVCGSVLKFSSDSFSIFTYE